MTNKNYFISLCKSEISISGFSVRFTLPFTDRLAFKVDVYSSGISVLTGFVCLTKRSILLSLCYEVPSLCKFSPYELREWCPAVFLPYTNYLDFMKFFEVSLDIFKSKNPSLIQLSHGS